MFVRSAIAGMIHALGMLLFGAAYLASVFLSYAAKGIGWAIASAIPVVGQLLWLGVMWSTDGPANWYSFLLGGAALLFGLARLIEA
jgi:hypothetical protein